MTPLRRYIQREQLGADPFDFEWDEWALVPYYNHDAYAQHALIAPLSIRAQLALSVATAEWVLTRMRSSETGTAAEDSVEAAWAGVVSPAYCVYTEPQDDDWRGVQRGPLQIVIVVLNDAIQLLNMDPDGARRCVWLYNLMLHISPRPDGFRQWFEAIVARLNRHHPRPPDSATPLFSHLPPGMGTAVPSEAFDPDVVYDPALDAARTDAMLQRLDWRQNQYLVPPDDVAASPIFEGTQPYRY